MKNSTKLKNRARVVLTGSELQALGVEIIALDKVVKLGEVKIGKLLGLLTGRLFSCSRTIASSTLVGSPFPLKTTNVFGCVACS